MAISRLFVEVGGDTSKLDDALKKAVTSAQNAGLEVKKAGERFITAFDAALNPTTRFVDQLKLLQAAGKSNADIMAVMGDKIRAAVEIADKNRQPVDALVRNIATLTEESKKGSLSFETLGRSIQDFARNPVEAAKAGISDLLSGLGPTAVGLGAVATAAVAAGVALFDMAKSAASEAESLQNLSVQTGLTTQELQALTQIGKEAGIEGLNLGRSLGMLNRQLADEGGKGAFAKGLKELKIDLIDLATGEPKTVIQLLDELGEKLRAIANPTIQARMANEALGEKGLRPLIPLLLNSKEGLRALIAEQERSGPVWDDITQNKLLAFDKALDIAGRTWSKLVTDIKAGVGSILVDLTGLAEGPKAQFENWPLNKQVEANLASQKGMVLEFSTGLKNLKVDIESFYKIRPENDNKEFEKIAAAWNQLADPIGLVIKRMKEFQSLGNSQSEVLRVMYPEIIKAGQAQLATGHALSESEKKYYDLAVAMDHYLNHSKNVMQANSDILRSFDPLANLPMPDFEKSASDIDKWARDIDKSIHGAFGKDPTFEAEVDARFTQIKPKMGEVAEIWRRQVSTIVTDFSRGMADIIFSGKSFGESLKNIFIDIGKSIIRTLTEILFMPFEKWLLRILTGAATVGTAAASTGGGIGGLGGLGGLGLGAAGTLAGIAGTAGIAGGMMMPGGVPGKIAGGLGMGVLGGAGAIYAGMVPGMGAATFGSALSYMSSGAFLPGIGAGGLLGLGAATMPVIGGAAIGLYYGIKALVDKINPPTEKSAATEVMRDFGLKVERDTVKQFIGQFINPEQAWGIRKDLLSSPAFLTQIAGPTAEAQGRMESFLKSLESIKTSFGTFNFREAFELGKSTGDWSELNKQFVDAFEHSNELRKMLPDFATKLLAVSDSTEAVKTETDILTDSLTGLRDTISASITPLKDMYQRFLETGEITEEFSKKITELGGDIQTFRELADLSAINNEFATMVDHFRQTGEILPRLRELFVQFGGDLKALDAAVALPGLQKQLSFINDIQSRLQALSPQGTAIEKMFSGQWDETMWGALASQGLDPSKLTNFIDLTKFKGGWEQAVSQFQQSGKMNTLLEQAIWKFGGQPGTVALQRLQQGFNTITPGLLTDVHSKMTEEYNKAVQSALDYIGSVQKETSDKITNLQTAVEEQFTLVGGNITTAIDSAKAAVVAVLNAILAQLGGTPVVAAATPQIANLPQPAGNPESPITIGNPKYPGPTSGVTVQVYVENAYGLDDLDNKVASSIARTVSRGGLRYMPA